MISHQLFIQCCKGDTKAQRLLYQMYAQKMFVHCFRYVSTKEDAEDIVAEGFIKVFKHLKKVEYRDPKSFEGWIRQLMVNECLQFLRKKKLLLYSTEEYTPEDTNNTIHSNIDAQDIYKMICLLPMGYRTVFNLYVIEGYTHDEIAKKLKIATSTSRSQLTKARALLKKILIQNNMV